MRKPQDRLGHRALVYELKHAIDRCMRRPWDTVAQGHLDDLIAQNPRSVRASHVLYNIGRARRDWLEAPLRGRLLPSPPDAHSLEVSR